MTPDGRIFPTIDEGIQYLGEISISLGNMNQALAHSIGYYRLKRGVKDSPDVYLTSPLPPTPFPDIH
ncbi:hypothetical protein GCM10010917_43580 [Paenibacillus physcomitrellae]|uniref:Tn3 transposase DDE domain-containing protein n=1 Tax=Paenibacillus physcomitrellae TaxID=1619311 RepID=A0ABQ1GZQ3_9BACL|nr:hypothetical protein GCM10010917_43580 [Paenibacillus physcomitrellae]GGJ33373.1 hypothetical protein GCM10008022_47580 [Paenibacillus hunanensis]